MVKYTVKNDFDAVFVQCFTNLFKGFIITQTTVNLFVVDCIVSVKTAFKKRIKNNAVNAHFFKMRNPIINLVKSVNKLTVILFWRSAPAEWIYIVNYRFVNIAHK